MVDNVTPQPTGGSIVTTVNWFKPIATLPAAGTSGVVTYPLLAMGDDQTHYIGVRAANSSGVEDLNTIVIAVAVPYNGPPRFGGPTSAVNAGGKVKVSWNDPVGATTSFTVAWTDGVTTNSTSIAAKDANGNYVESFTTPTVLPGLKTYTFTVHAIDRFNFPDSNTQTQVIPLETQPRPMF